MIDRYIPAGPSLGHDQQLDRAFASAGALQSHTPIPVPVPGEDKVAIRHLVRKAITLDDEQPTGWTADLANHSKPSATPTQELLCFENEAHDPLLGRPKTGSPSNGSAFPIASAM